MFTVPEEILTRFSRRLAHESINEKVRPFYRKWLRYYFDFCRKYQHDLSSRKSLAPVIDKLKEKIQPDNLCRQSERAVSLFYAMGDANLRNTASQTFASKSASPVKPEGHSPSHMKNKSVATQDVSKEAPPSVAHVA